MSAPELTSREVALAIIPHITGALSMLGSLYIAVTVLRSKQKRGKTYHRLLVAEPIGYHQLIFLLSFYLADPSSGRRRSGWVEQGKKFIVWYSIHNLFIDLINLLLLSKACEGCSPYHYGAVGTQGTCTAQGWGIQYGITTTSTYNVMLAIHYLLTIRWNFSERRLKSKVEPYMLIIPPLVGLVLLSLPQIFLKYYNDTNLWCWIKASWEYEDAVKRSYNARWAFAYGPLWAFIAFITLAQIYLWSTVRKIEKRTMRFTSFSTARQQTRHSRRVASQAALYVGVFYATNLPYTIIAATQRFYNPHTTGGFCALLAVVVFAPLQGFLNLFVYRRQQIIKAAKVGSSRIGKSFRVVKKRTSESTSDVVVESDDFQEGENDTKAVSDRNTKSMGVEFSDEFLDNDLTYRISESFLTNLEKLAPVLWSGASCVPPAKRRSKKLPQ